MLKPDQNATQEEIVMEWEETLRKPAEQRDVQRAGMISDLFDRDILSNLEKAFSSSDSGNNSLTAMEFRNLMSEYIPESLIETIYRAIDVNDAGYLNYSDFTNYLIAAEAGSRFSSQTYASRLVLAVQQEADSSVMHRDFIDSLVYVRKPIPMLITGGRDGQISIWDPEELKLITHINHRDKSLVYQEELSKGMNTLLRARCKKHSSAFSRKKKAAGASKVAITALCPFLSSGMICVGSADGCVTLYELGTQVCVWHCIALHFG